ncbi:Cytochrome p450 [Mycena venus]|uniref:Cytochrome p450 n=1 Tax=Mycena venus TaxID=2733690 RepID=A0A8H6XMF5_9AGAR|nr:Cytochrome p450 [Mycena venus]
MFKLLGLGFATFLLSFVSAQVAPAFGQCDGLGFNTALSCASGLTCVQLSKDYSQCAQDHVSGPADPQVVVPDLIGRAAQVTAVSVVVKDAALGPAPPPGLVYIHLTSTGSLNNDEAHYPVLVIAGYSYWAFSYIDNRVGLAILAYDPSNNEAGRWDMTGTRYIVSIVYNSANGSVVFTGQGGSIITVPIIQFLEPIVFQSTANAATQPAAPSGLDYIHLTDPNTLNTDNTHYPVLILGTHTYWPLSYTDNRVSLNLVAYDENKNLISQVELPGTRYIFTLAYDPDNGSIELIGQGSAVVTVSITQVL